MGLLGTTALVSALPDDLIPAPPNWGIPLVGVVIFAAGLFLRSKVQPTLVDDSGWDDSRWFAHAENLLRGRYLFSRAQAADALLEARNHRASTGLAGTLAAEFGNVEVFAAQLAAINAPAIKRGAIVKRLGTLAILAYFAIFFVLAPLIDDGLSWRNALYIVVLIVGGIIAARSFRPNRIVADTKLLKKRRMAQARALGTLNED